MDPASVRASIGELTRVCRSNCSAGEPEGDEMPHVVTRARLKAIAIDAELEVLAGNEEAALLKHEATRDAAAAAGRPLDGEAPVFEARVAEVRAAATHKRVALQTEAVALDAALERVLASVDALTEAAASLDDSELVTRAPSLFRQEAEARAAVAAILVCPTTSGFLDLAAVPLPPSPEALLSAPADSLFGRVLVAPILSPHIHTSHCKPGCALRFAPHTHSAACNHARTPLGAVWTAAKRGDITGLEAALEAGGSTEGMDGFFQTALHFASENGYMEAVHMLVAAGADMNAQSRNCRTPLGHARQSGRADIAAFLEAAGATE